MKWMKRIAWGLVLFWCAGLLFAATHLGDFLPHPVFLLAVALPLSLAFVLFSAGWLIRRDAVEERGRRLADCGAQTDDEFIADSGIEGTRLDLVRAIRETMAK